MTPDRLAYDCYILSALCHLAHAAEDPDYYALRSLLAVYLDLLGCITNLTRGF